MPGAPKNPGPPSTEADLLALPDHGRGFELLDGELVEKQSGFRHGRAQLRLGHCLAPYDRGSGGGDRPGGWWFVAEQLVAFGPQVLRPDVAGWQRERLPEPPADQETVVHVRPDWIAEIVSTSNAGNDLVKKRRIYYQHRVPHYWIIDPRDEILTVLRWTPEGYVEIVVAPRQERIHAEPFAAVELAVGVLFGDDEDTPPEGP
jgi:Uma2 family endonuclease